MNEELKNQWAMTLKSIQYDENEKTETTLNTEILYYIDKNGERVISYEESETTGMEGSDMQLRISPDNMISIIRTGTYQTHLVVQPGRKHFCHYETPFGDFAVGISARFVRNKLTDEGGSLRLRYTVDANSTLLSDNEIWIDIKKYRS
ncbi:MAG: DUF1934 domain-containing protein [Ruminococcus sp.]|nr:DUF1934 domain-containing protein [Ruminococcus sp.]